MLVYDLTVITPCVCRSNEIVTTGKIFSELTSSRCWNQPLSRWRYHDNLQAVNGSMHWQEDYLAFSLLADYLFKTNEFFGEINAIVNSTIPTLPRAAAIAKHRVIWKKSADTLLSFQVSRNYKVRKISWGNPQIVSLWPTGRLFLFKTNKSYLKEMLRYTT